MVQKIKQKELTGKWYYFFSTIILLSLFPFSVDANILEKYYYSRTIGSKNTLVEWKLEEQDLLKLTWTANDETVVAWHDSSLTTQKYLISRPGEQTRVTVERFDNSLLITGNFKGKAIEKRLTIDPLPWCQSLSISLRPFVLSCNDFLEFWILRPDTLKIYKIRASKLSSERLACNGRTINIQKVRLNLTGMLSFIMESYYWFRKNDGVFIKYLGPATLGNNRKIIIEILENPLELQNTVHR
jgi:hypothetical protein